MPFREPSCAGRIENPEERYANRDADPGYPSVTSITATRQARII
jgi:hypothetical protein